jgi:hypothetical protein
VPNEQLLAALNGGILNTLACDVFAIEMIASYGMAVGREVFETCVWIGRFMQQFHLQAQLVFRRDIKLHHCQSVRAKDTNIRQALIDKYGAPGTKKNPGLTYGITSHLWAAFALATFVSETAPKSIFHRGNENKI